MFFIARLLFRVREVKTEKEIKDFRKIWRKVWLKEGYADNLERIEKHYSRFTPYSTDLLLKFLGILPIGTLRLIWENKEVQLPMIQGFETQTVWKGTVVEFTLMTLKKRWRGLFHLPSIMLWRKGYRLARKEKREGILMAADRRIFKLLSKIFPFQQIGKEKFYEGSFTYPAFLNLDTAEKVLSKKAPQLFKFFTK